MCVFLAIKVNIQLNDGTILPHDIAILWIYGQKLSEFNLQHPLTCDGAMLPLSLYSFPDESVDEVKVTLNTLGFAASKSVEFEFLSLESLLGSLRSSFPRSGFSSWFLVGVFIHG